MVSHGVVPQFRSIVPKCLRLNPSFSASLFDSKFALRQLRFYSDPNIKSLRAGTSDFRSAFYDAAAIQKAFDTVKNVSKVEEISTEKEPAVPEPLSQVPELKLDKAVSSDTSENTTAEANSNAEEKNPEESAEAAAKGAEDARKAAEKAKKLALMKEIFLNISQGSETLTAESVSERLLQAFPIGSNNVTIIPDHLTSLIYQLKMNEKLNISEECLARIQLHLQLIEGTNDHYQQARTAATFEEEERHEPVAVVYDCGNASASDIVHRVVLHLIDGRPTMWLSTGSKDMLEELSSTFLAAGFSAEQIRFCHAPSEISIDDFRPTLISARTASFDVLNDTTLLSRTLISDSVVENHKLLLARDTDVESKVSELSLHTLFSGIVKGREVEWRERKEDFFKFEMSDWAEDLVSLVPGHLQIKYEKLASQLLEFLRGFEQKDLVKSEDQESQLPDGFKSLLESGARLRGNVHCVVTSDDAVPLHIAALALLTEVIPRELYGKTTSSSTSSSDTIPPHFTLHVLPENVRKDPLKGFLRALGRQDGWTISHASNSWEELGEIFTTLKKDTQGIAPLVVGLQDMHLLPPSFLQNLASADARVVPQHDVPVADSVTFYKRFFSAASEQKKLAFPLPDCEEIKAFEVKEDDLMNDFGGMDHGLDDHNDCGHDHSHDHHLDEDMEDEDEDGDVKNMDFDQFMKKDFSEKDGDVKHCKDSVLEEPRGKLDLDPRVDDAELEKGWMDVVKETEGKKMDEEEMKKVNQMGLEDGEKQKASA